jgi:hypothetical protein
LTDAVEKRLPSADPSRPSAWLVLRTERTQILRKSVKPGPIHSFAVDPHRSWSGSLCNLDWNGCPKTSTSMLALEAYCPRRQALSYLNEAVPRDIATIRAGQSGVKQVHSSRKARLFHPIPAGIVRISPFGARIMQHFHADNPARAKRLAKRLRRLLTEVGIEVSLPACQNAVAEMYGFAHFHEMQQNQGRYAPSPCDEDVGQEIATERLNRHVDVLMRRYGISQANAAEIVEALKPTATHTPRRS